jgi:hypothetical protein
MYYSIEPSFYYGYGHTNIGGYSLPTSLKLHVDNNIIQQSDEIMVASNKKYLGIGIALGIGVSLFMIFIYALIKYYYSSYVRYTKLKKYEEVV